MPTIEARLHINPRRALDMLRKDRQLRRAARQIPRPVTWDWAKSRLIPLLAGPYLGPDPLVTAVAEPGCAVNFGIEIAGTYLLVDRPVSERWEAHEDLLHRTAISNLERRAEFLRQDSLTHGTLSGRVIRMLESVPWASSLVLAPVHLIRIFGREDQVFATPHRGCLVACDPEIPPRVMAEIVVELEYKAAWPLLLDPFALVDGTVVWQEDKADEP